MSAVSAYHLLGRLEDGNLILLAGPNYNRVRELASASGIPAHEAVNLTEDEEIAAAKARIQRTGESILVIASMVEVEGRLDRSAFSRQLTNLAYAADRVIYAGSNGAALVHPVSPGTTMSVHNGSLSVRQHFDIVAAGQSVTGLTVDRL